MFKILAHLPWMVSMFSNSLRGIGGEYLREE